MKIICFSIVLMLITAFASISAELPTGWRFPTPKELADSDRDDSPTRYTTAKADFNDDGVNDEAVLLKSTMFSGEALWVRVSRGRKSFSWVKLSETKWGPEYPDVDLSMGIEVVNPGTHTYACFDNADDCNFGDTKSRPKLKLRNSSLMYFKLGSAASLFFWSNKEKKFLRVWISD